MSENATAKEPWELWVEALESGEYQQARKRLNVNDCYCCLGVACEVYQKYGPGDLDVLEEQIRDENNKPATAKRYDDAMFTLPLKVASWLGLNQVNGQFWMAKGPSESLTSLNDHGKSFAEIAELIKSRPDGMFGTPEPAPSPSED
jgi:hypothetical protein